MTVEVQYEIEERRATEATVRVTVEPEAFREELDAVYRRYAREVRIPGFRKGHVPRNVLDSRFGRDAFVAETQEELERRHLPEALVNLGLRPVSRPRLEVVSNAEEDPFVFKASFDVLPEVDLPAYREREVEVPPVSPVSEDNVNGALAEVQSQFATLEEKEGETVSEGDIVHVREGDHEWDTRADRDHPATEALIGARVGSDVEIDVESEDGERIQTTLSIVGLRQIERPEIDDELAKDAGFDSLDALKADIEEKLGEARRERHEERVASAVLDRVVSDTDIPLPASFIDELLNDEVERLEASLQEQGRDMSFAEYVAEQGTNEEESRRQLRTSIEKRLRRELVLRRIAAEEAIEIDDAELEELARADAESAGEDPLRFVARLKAQDRWDDYRTRKVNERVFALLRETAIVSDQTEPRIVDPTKDRPNQGRVIDPTKEGGGA